MQRSRISTAAKLSESVTDLKSAFGVQRKLVLATSRKAKSKGDDKMARVYLQSEVNLLGFKEDLL